MDGQHSHSPAVSDPGLSGASGPIFSLFPRFPAEIRRKIWSFALKSEWAITTIAQIGPYREHPRVPAVPENARYRMHGINSNRVPPAAQACFEARQVLEEERVCIYTRCRLGERRGTDLGWIDPEQQLFYFGYGVAIEGRAGAVSLTDLIRPQFCEVVQHIRHIAILPQQARHIEFIPKILGDTWGQGTQHEGLLRTVTIIAPRGVIDFVDRTMTVSPDVPAYFGDPIKWVSWACTMIFANPRVDVDWTPLIRDLEAGGDPINPETPWDTVWADRGFEFFQQDGLSSVKLYWRTPEQAMRSRPGPYVVAAPNLDIERRDPPEHSRSRIRSFVGRMLGRQ